MKGSEAEMPDQEKIVQALQICASREPGEYTCNKCFYETRVDGNGCEVNLMLDVIAMLKEQEARIKKFELERSWDENPDTMGKW